MTQARRHLVLIGLPGAGKSVTGRLLAALLETGFTDLDDRVVERAGTSIPELFVARGEAAFRELEREAMTDALGRTPHVIAPGGGWACQPGNLERADVAALIIHLRVTPVTAAARLGPAHQRPLLAGDPVSTLERLWDLRAPFYERAPVQVDTEGLHPGEVAARLLAVAAPRAGW